MECKNGVLVNNASKSLKEIYQQQKPMNITYSTEKFAGALTLALKSIMKSAT